MSTGPAPSASLLRRLISGRLEKRPELEVLAISLPGPWQGEERWEILARPCRLAWCPSALAVRAELAAPRTAGELLVLLTDRDASELGADVLARLPQGQLRRIDPWNVLLDAVAAYRFDPRLPNERWFPEALLAAAPPTGLLPAPAGFLSFEQGWGMLLEHAFGLEGGWVDLEALLSWSLEEEGPAAFAAASPAVVRGVVEHVAGSAGTAAAALLRLAAAGRAADALPLGLALEALFSPRAEGPRVEDEPLLAAALARLEPWLGGETLSNEAARSWAETAGAEARRRLETGAPEGLALLTRAEALLSDLKLGSAADRSTLLPQGLELRFERLAAALSTALARRPAVSGEALEEAFAAVLGHERLAVGRRAPLEMMVRLVRWLERVEARPPMPARGLAECARAYAREGAYVDRARATARLEVGGVLAVPLAALLERVAVVRERENELFGAVVGEAASWTSPAAGLVPVECLLGEVVVPLARQVPVLLLVIDGMSLAVFDELLPSLERHGWNELSPEVGAEGALPRRLALAALPSITEVCRRSLFGGELARGGQAEEKQAFIRALRGVGRSQRAAELFHQDALRTPHGSGLDERARAAITGGELRVVGVVVNAVDDFLTRSEQLAPRWELEAVPSLAAVLEAAAEGGRAVVITADHGHVLERGLEERRADDGGARFRWTGPPTALEVEVSGPRVLVGPDAGAEGRNLIVPWSDGLRYGRRANGYHGGASPQELLVPLVVLARSELEVPGFTLAAGEEKPSWWQRPASEPPASQPRRRRRVVAKPAVVASPGPPQIPLFETPPFLTSGEEPPWIARLLTSAAFAQQRRLAGRAPIEDSALGQLLAHLDRHGGRMTRLALARAMGLPLLRLAGYLAALERLLNVDGYPVISRDDEDSVSLDRELLATQFDLEVER